MFQYYNWEEVDINWELLDMNWEEVGIIINDVLPHVISFPPISGGVGKPKYNLKKLNELPEEKKRIIIKIACEIDGKEYIDYKYKNENIKITAKDINLIMNKLYKNVVVTNIK